MSKRTRTYDSSKVTIRVGDHEVPLSALRLPDAQIAAAPLQQRIAPILSIHQEVKQVPWWNNIRRAWMIDGPSGPVFADPQPPPPVFGTSISVPDVPPAVKVTA